MNTLWKKQKNLLIIATLLIITIITSIYYYQYSKKDTLMKVEFNRIFNTKAPTNPEEKTKIQTQVRLKLIELRLKQTLATTENYSTQFPTLIKLLNLSPETIHASAKQSTQNFYQARDTAKYFGYTFIETTPTSDLIKEYLKQAILPN